MGRARGDQKAVAVTRRRHRREHPPTQVIPVAKWLAGDRPWGSGLFALGGNLKLSGADENVDSERWFPIEKETPINSIQGLSHLEGVTRLLSGLYRVTFKGTFALVNVEGRRIALARGADSTHRYAGLYAAMGHHALYANSERSELKSKLAGAYYWLEDADPEPTGEQLAALADAAIALLRAEGGVVEVDPADLMLMANPEDAPAPELVTRLEAGEEGAYEVAWEAYVTALAAFRSNPHSESPELDRAELSRFEDALSVHALAQAAREAEPIRQAMHAELLGAPPRKGEYLDEEACSKVSQLLHFMMEAEGEGDDQAPERNLCTELAIDEVLQQISEEFEIVDEDPAALERIMPMSTRHRLEAQTPERQCSATEALQKGAGSDTCFHYLHAAYGTGSRVVDWPLLREIAESCVVGWMAGPTKDDND